MEKLNVIFISVFLLGLLFSPPIYASKTDPMTREVQLLKLENIQLKNRIDDLKAHIIQMENDVTTLANKLDNIDTQYKSAISEIENYKRTADTIMKITEYVLFFFFGIAALAGYSLYRYVKNNFDNLVLRTGEEVSGATKKIHKGIGRLYNSMAYLLWDRIQEVPSKRENYMFRMLDFQKIAVAEIEVALGTDLSKLADNEKYMLLNFWHNRAYYLAMEKDIKHSSWAIDKARIAFEWGSGKRDFVPPAPVKAPIMDWIDTYLYVLKQFDLSDLRQEWVVNYQEWRDALEEYDPDDSSNYREYYKDFKERKGT